MSDTEQISIFLNEESEELLEEEILTVKKMLTSLCNKGLDILRNFDKQTKSSINLYTREEEKQRLSVLLSKDINPIFDEILGLLKPLSQFRLNQDLLRYPITKLKIYHFMDLYINHCNIKENEYRIKIAKTMVLLMPIDSLRFTDIKINHKRKQTIGEKGNILLEDLQHLESTEQCLLPMSDFLYDVIKEHSLDEMDYTQEEKNMIVFIACKYLDKYVYRGKGKRKSNEKTPYIMKLEEIITTIFSKYEGLKDPDVCSTRCTAQSYFNQRMAKETVELYNQEKKREKEEKVEIKQETYQLTLF